MFELGVPPDFDRKMKAHFTERDLLGRRKNRFPRRHCKPLFEFESVALADLISIQFKEVSPSYASIRKPEANLSDYTRIPLEVVIPKDRDLEFKKLLSEKGIGVTYDRTSWVAGVDLSREIGASCEQVLAAFGFSAGLPKKVLSLAEIRAGVESVGTNISYFATYRNLPEAEAATIFKEEIAKLCPAQVIEEKEEKAEAEKRPAEGSQKPTGGEEEKKFAIQVDWKKAQKTTFRGVARLADILKTWSSSVSVKEKPGRAVEGFVEANEESWQEIGELFAGLSYLVSAKGKWEPRGTVGRRVNACGQGGPTPSHFAFPDRPRYALVLRFVRYDARPAEILPNCPANQFVYRPAVAGMLYGQMNHESGRFGDNKGKIKVFAEPKAGP